MILGMNIALITSNDSRFEQISSRLEPSSIIPRAACVMCVRGKISVNFCTQGCRPSSENHTPDKNIMGQESIFSIPLQLAPY